MTAALESSTATSPALLFESYHSSSGWRTFAGCACRGCDAASCCTAASPSPSSDAPNDSAGAASWPPSSGGVWSAGAGAGLPAAGPSVCARVDAGFGGESAWVLPLTSVVTQPRKLVGTESGRHLEQRAPQHTHPHKHSCFPPPQPPRTACTKLRAVLHAEAPASAARPSAKAQWNTATLSLLAHTSPRLAAGALEQPLPPRSPPPRPDLRRMQNCASTC